jgi:DNA invertase Pin-like site-specific DNA recombinase
MSSGKFVAYYRVSTERQGRSGLGLHAQRKAVMDYLNGGAWNLVAEFTETESGKLADRPELLKALEACRRQKATLVIAKLDRLSRNVAFISNLMEGGVEFVAVDFPSANKLTLHVLAAVAEHEREMISQRTRDALAAAKARGTALGWSIASRKGEQAAAARHGADENKEQADRHAANVLPIISQIRAAGITTLQGVATALNARGVRTARNKQWHPTTVRNVLSREA